MTDSNGNATAVLTITAQHEAPQAFASEVPDAVPPELLPDFPRDDDTPLTAADAEYQVVADDDLPRVVVLSQPLEFEVTITSPLRDFVAEDAAEFDRLEQRVLAEPTSFRAQQELLSFKTLKGIV